MARNTEFCLENYSERFFLHCTIIWRKTTYSVKKNGQQQICNTKLLSLDVTCFMSTWVACQYLMNVKMKRSAACNL